MSSGLTLLWGTALSCLVLVQARDWVFAVLLALLEGCWVGLIATYGALAVALLDVTLFYWAAAWLFLAAAELVLTALALLLYSHATGQSALRR